MSQFVAAATSTPSATRCTSPTGPPPTDREKAFVGDVYADVLATVEQLLQEFFDTLRGEAILTTRTITGPDRCRHQRRRGSRGLAAIGQRSRDSFQARLRLWRNPTG
jgi:hypothetical protein